MVKISRRELLTAAGATGALIALGCGTKQDGGTSVTKQGSSATVKTPGGIAVASGTDPRVMVAAAVAALGGMSKFVKQGNKVVIKPNAAWARRPQDAATTNPEVVAALVQLCKEAGASRVVVVDHVIDRPEDMVLQLTGIKAAAEAAGATVGSGQLQSRYRPFKVKNSKILSEEHVLAEILDADVFINVPVGKCHSDTKVSLGMKNLMGTIWSRQPWHTSASVNRCIADFAAALHPHLTILDANRILLTNGPKGPGKTKDVRQVIAGVDQVAVDAYGASLFGLKPEEVDHIRFAKERGLGEIDLSRIEIVKV